MPTEDEKEIKKIARRLARIYTGSESNWQRYFAKAKREWELLRKRK